MHFFILLGCVARTELWQPVRPAERLVSAWAAAMDGQDLGALAPALSDGSKRRMARGFVGVESVAYYLRRTGLGSSVAELPPSLVGSAEVVGTVRDDSNELAVLTSGGELLVVPLVGSGRHVALGIPVASTKYRPPRASDSAVPAELKPVWTDMEAYFEFLASGELGDASAMLDPDSFSVLQQSRCGRELGWGKEYCELEAADWHVASSYSVMQRWDQKRGRVERQFVDGAVVGDKALLRYWVVYPSGMAPSFHTENLVLRDGVWLREAPLWGTIRGLESDKAPFEDPFGVWWNSSGELVSDDCGEASIELRLGLGQEVATVGCSSSIVGVRKGDHSLVLLLDDSVATRLVESRRSMVTTAMEAGRQYAVRPPFRLSGELVGQPFVGKPLDGSWLVWEVEFNEADLDTSALCEELQGHVRHPSRRDCR